VDVFSKEKIKEKEIRKENISKRTKSKLQVAEGIK